MPLTDHQRKEVLELGNMKTSELRKIVYQDERGTHDAIRHTYPTRGSLLLACIEIRFALYEKPSRPPKENHLWKQNLMSGRWIEVAKGTPRCCDPSTETYWAL